MNRRAFDLLEDARGRLQEAKQSGPGEIKSEGYLADRSIVQLRDYLIERFRGHDGEQAQVKASLEKVNAALSLIVGLEFPLSGLKRKFVDEALQLLDQVNVS